jgi:hypothetical protein
LGLSSRWRIRNGVWVVTLLCSDIARLYFKA